MRSVVLVMAIFSFPIASLAQSLKIGVAVCLSTECAADGQSALNGLLLAQDELKTILGLPIELVVEDTAEAVSGMKAVTAFKKLRTNPEIKYFVGPSWTPGGLSLAPLLAKETDIVITAPSLGARDFHESSEVAFNAYGVDDELSREVARYLLGIGVKTAGVFTTEQSWESNQARFFTEEFERLGGKVVVTELVSPELTDLGSVVLNIVRRKPEAVFTPTFVRLPHFAKELNRLRYPGHRLSVYWDAEVHKQSNGAMEGFRYFWHSTPEESFASRYRERFGTEPLLSAGICYDILFGYKRAIEESNTLDTKVVRAKLKDVDFAGVAGRYAYAGERAIKRKYKGFLVKGGIAVSLE